MTLIPIKCFKCYVFFHFGLYWFSFKIIRLFRTYASQQFRVVWRRLDRGAPLVLKTMQSRSYTVLVSITDESKERLIVQVEIYLRRLLSTLRAQNTIEATTTKTKRSLRGLGEPKESSKVNTGTTIDNLLAKSQRFLCRTLTLTFWKVR